MRKTFLFVVGILMMVGTLAAQHDNMKEKAVSDYIVFQSDVRVGTTLLKAGEYRVTCDRETISFKFVAEGKKVLEVKCQGKDTGKKAEDTLATYEADASGVRHVKTLMIHGSTIEHTFN